VSFGAVEPKAVNVCRLVRCEPKAVNVCRLVRCEPKAVNVCLWCGVNLRLLMCVFGAV
jgi:hypothetical protein